MWPFRKRLKSFLLNDKLKISEAFIHQGKRYYTFDNAFDMTTGRGLQAMTIYDEFNMRADRSYLEKHCKAVETILNSSPVKLTQLAIIHNNLKERLSLAPFPDHIYKLASVLFWDDSESPYSYDSVYNNRKIAAWRADPDMLPFLVKVPLRDFLPYTHTEEENLNTYFRVVDQINEVHHSKMLEVLSKLQ